MSAAALLIGCENLPPGWRWLQSPSKPAQALDEEAFQAGTDRAPTAKTLYALARILAVQGKDAECEFLLKRIVREHKEFVPAYCDLAELQARQRRIDEAIGTLKHGLAQSSNDPVLLNNLGMCRVLQGRYDAALGLFGQAGSASPQNARYRANMGMTLGMLGRYEESLSLYEQVVSPAEAHSNLAVICEARGDKARAAQERALARKLASAPRPAPEHVEKLRPSPGGAAKE